MEEIRRNIQRRIKEVAQFLTFLLWHNLANLAALVRRFVLGTMLSKWLFTLDLYSGL